MATPRHKLLKDAKTFIAKVELYLADCQANDKPASLAGMARSLGIHKAMLTKWHQTYSSNEWLKRADDGDVEAVNLVSISNAIKSMQDASEDQLLTKAYQKNSGTVLGLLKCIHGYQEQATIKHEHTGDVKIEISFGIPKSESGY